MTTDIKANTRCFSARRFGSYFQLYLTTNKRMLLLGAGAALILPFIFILITYYTDGSDFYDFDRGFIPGYDRFWRQESTIFSLFVYFFMIVSGAWMFQAMRGKRERLGVIELPASQLEKFLAWWVICVPVSLLVTLLGVWIADIMRVGYMHLFTTHGSDVHFYPIKDILCLPLNPRHPLDDVYASYESDGVIVLIYYSTMIAANSLFALGSILFHKLSFLKTIGALFAMWIVYIFIFIAGEDALLGTDYSATSRFDMDSDGGFYVLSGISWALAIFFYWLSYARMKEDDIINRW